MYYLLQNCICHLTFAFPNLVQPHWCDLDVNQHVNNVKYIGWMLEVIMYEVLILIEFFVLIYLKMLLA